MMFFPSLSLSLFFLFGVSLTAALPLASKDSDISDADPVPIGDHLPMVRETFEPEDLVGRDNYRDSSGKYTPLNPRRSRAWSTSSWMKERNSAHVPLRRQEGLPNPNAQPAEVAVGGFTLIKKYQGREFLEWDFHKKEDPTEGFVNYQSREQSEQQKLAWVNEKGQFCMKVDDTTKLEAGQYRNSVRIESVLPLPERVLVIMDASLMPHGCSVWPAYWTVGKDKEKTWPNKGEIDILEGIHNQKANQIAYHTKDGCIMDTDIPTDMASEPGSPQCAVHPPDNTGCYSIDNGPNAAKSYGQGFNAAGGGVYVYGRTTEAIKIWFFTRSEIPQDITNGNPNPASWPKPVSILKNTKCPLDDHFIEQVMTFDTTLCGQWAGPEWAKSGCEAEMKVSCAEAVLNPENYKNAKWEVNYVSVYQPTA